MRLAVSPDEIQWLAGEIQCVRHEIRQAALQLREDPSLTNRCNYWIAQSKFYRFRRFYEFENLFFLYDLRRGEHDAVEDAIVFLNADPYCFRSGYIKKKLCRAVTHAKLTPGQRLLLRDIVIRMVTVPRPVAFQGFVELGCALYTSGFHARVRNLKIPPFKYMLERKRILLDAMERERKGWEEKMKKAEKRSDIVTAAEPEVNFRNKAVDMLQNFFSLFSSEKDR